MSVAADDGIIGGRHTRSFGATPPRAQRMSITAMESIENGEVNDCWANEHRGVATERGRRPF